MLQDYNGWIRTLSITSLSIGLRFVRILHLLIFTSENWNSPQFTELDNSCQFKFTFPFKSETWFPPPAWSSVIGEEFSKLVYQLNEGRITSLSMEQHSILYVSCGFSFCETRYVIHRSESKTPASRRNASVGRDRTRRPVELRVAPRQKR